MIVILRVKRDMETDPLRRKRDLLIYISIHNCNHSTFESQKRHGNRPIKAQKRPTTEQKRPDASSLGRFPRHRIIVLLSVKRDLDIDLLRRKRDLLRSKRDLMPAALASSPDIGS
jgi:hypothetical protein